jgi:hypothetical protein
VGHVEADRRFRNAHRLEIVDYRCCDRRFVAGDAFDGQIAHQTFLCRRDVG